MATDSTNGPASLADQIANLAPGEWANLATGNGFFDVATTRAEHDEIVANGSEPFWGWGGPEQVFLSWNSAAFDAQENRMFFMGGGRTNYGGNEVYQFDFDTLKWSRVNKPSPLTEKDWDDPLVDGPSPDDVHVPADAPPSPHTYDSQLWNPVTQSFWLTSTYTGFDDNNASVGPRIPSDAAVWELDIETGEWTEHPASSTFKRGSSVVIEDTGQILALDNSSSHDVFAYLYDPDGTEHDLGQVRHPDGSALQRGTDVFANPDTNDYYVTAPDGFYKLDIGEDRVVAEQAVEFPSVTELGTTFPFQEAGYAYRPVDGKFYIWNGGPRIARWDPDSDTIEILWNETATNAPAGDHPVNGRVFGKWTYLEEQDAFAGVTNGETFIWRPGDNPPDINEADVGSLRVDYQTSGALGVFLPLESGDKNRDSNVELAFREAGTSTWRDASDLLQMRPELNSVSSPSPEGYAGSVFGLAPDTSYEIRATVSDPDGVQGEQTQIVTAQTRQPAPSEPSSPNVVEVDTVAGLRQALDSATAGDVIELQPGDYDLDSPVGLKASGTADNPIVLRAADRDATTIDANNGSGVFVGGSNAIVENLNIVNAAKGIQIKDVQNVTLRGNEIAVNDVDDRGQKGIWGNGTDVHIVDNQLFGPFAFGRVDTGGSDRGIDVSGSDIEIDHNTLAGFLDAIAGGDDGGVGVEIHHNKVLWATDNGIELDGGLRNVAAHDNMIANTAAAVSAQPVQGGPAYVFDNVIHNVLRSPFKVKPLDSQPQGIYILNNTITKAGAAWVNNSGDPSQITVANNLFLAEGTNNFGNTLMNTSEHRLLEMDHNAWLTDGDFRINLNGQSDINVDKFSEWRDWTPFGNNSVLLENDPLLANMEIDFETNGFDVFRDPTVADFRPDSASAVVDAGTVFPNINGDFTGNGPDIGAFETDEAIPTYGSRRIDDPDAILRPDTLTDVVTDTTTIDVLANDFALGGNALEIQNVTDPNGGTVSMTDVTSDSGHDELTFSPDPDFLGIATFDYVVGQDSPVRSTVTVPVMGSDTTPPGSAAPLSDVGTYESNQTGSGTATASDSSEKIRLEGNTWNQVPYSYDVTQSTLMTFEARVDTVGEIHAIGVDADTNWDNGNDLNFFISGTQSSVTSRRALDASFETDTTEAWKTFVVDLGARHTGTVNHLTFINDDDDGSGDADASYRNIRLFEGETDSSGGSSTDSGSSGGDSGSSGNSAPVAESDTASTTNDQAVTISVLDNDSDPDGDGLDIARVGAAANGTVTLNDNGSGDGSDTITFTPDTGFEGLATFDYTVSDGNGGEASANVEVDVTAATATPMAYETISLNSDAVSSYDTQDNGGTATVSNDGTEISLSGNTWKTTALDAEITSGMVLRFEARVESVGEIQGIGFDADGDWSNGNDLAYVLAGTQTNVSNRESLTYDHHGEASANWQQFEIEIGDQYQGEVSHLTFINDNDASDGAEASYRDIRLGKPVKPYTFETSDFGAYPADGSQDQGGSVSATNDGTTFKFTGNTWKSVTVENTVTADTVLQFDAKIESEGEIQGIGVDTDQSWDNGNDLAYVLAGTQTNVSSRDGLSYEFHEKADDSWQTFNLDLGSDYQGEISRLTFINDDDRSDADVEAAYRDIRLMGSGTADDNDAIG